MELKHHHKRFTFEQINQLAANPFASKVVNRHICFTLEFQNLFLSRHEKGESSSEIFASLGYALEGLGLNRFYGYPRKLKRQLESVCGLTETAGRATA